MASLGPAIIAGGPWRGVIREAAEIVALGLDHHELACGACGSGEVCAAGASLRVALAELVRIGRPEAEGQTVIAVAA